MFAKMSHTLYKMRHTQNASHTIQVSLTVCFTTVKTGFHPHLAGWILMHEKQAGSQPPPTGAHLDPSQVSQGLPLTHLYPKVPQTPHTADAGGWVSSPKTIAHPAATGPVGWYYYYC